MDIKARKLELLDWLMKVNDEMILKKIESLKKEFPVQTKKPTSSPTFGRLKGKIKIAEDFNAPLEDMKDYM